jgi:hypothetical protein
MKRSVLTIFTISFFLLMGMQRMQAQKFQGAVIAGFNLTQVDGDDIYGYNRIGAHLGAAAILPIKKWDITLETLFNQKGSFQRAIYPGDSINYQYDLRLNYIEIPLMVHYTDRQVIGAGLGFSYGRLVSFKEIEHEGNFPPYSDSVKFNKDDFNVLAEVQFRIYKGLKLNLRFAYSIIPIRTRTFTRNLSEPLTRKQYNNALTFTFVYILNDRYIKPKKAEKE